MRLRPTLLALALSALPLAARADQHFSREVFFSNSLSPDFFPGSEAGASAPSTLEVLGGTLEEGHLYHAHLPVDTSQFISGPNSLRLHWTSAPTGGWSAELNLYRFRDRRIDWDGTTLSLWLWSPQPVPAADLPRIAFTDLDHNHTAPLPLQQFSGDLPARRWTRIRIPLDTFATASLHPFTPRHLTGIVLSQGTADNQPHTLLLDEIRVLDSHTTGLDQPPAAPTNLTEIGRAHV